ncbi:MAG: BamA/TamA family outer membrane protein, partial [Bacteroides sp.]|nr:BamA/TamA family outer membrane protein [Bacteroides sp.]
GVDYLYVDTDTEVSVSIIDPDFKFKNGSQEAAIGFILDYDTRDTTFTPSEGLLTSVSASLYREAVGGDTNYDKYEAKALYFTSITEVIPLGLRVDVEAIDGERGEIPFYAYPFIDLRGIPMMRYQGDNTAVGEIELGWKFTPRWTVIGFGGVGRTEDIGQSDSATTVYTRGAGLRYFIARRFGAHIGFDVAKGPEDTAFYLQFGHAWD